jgi:uncharacterized protein (DUF885 family)
MKQFFWSVCIICTIVSCKLSNTNPTGEANKELATLFNNYYKERLELFPLESTQNGDSNLNDKMYVDFTDSYRGKLKAFYSKHLAYIKSFDREYLNANDKISYDIFKREMEMSIEGLSFHDNYIPFQQFWGLPLTMGQLGSGDGNQPFKTIKDYNDWLSRATVFGAWADSAIVYFRKGIAANYVLPAALVQKIIPQMEAMVVADPTKSLFYAPINKMPFKLEEDNLSPKYVQLISQTLVPAYKKLADFLKNEYLPKARTTTGINALPDGDKYYKFLVRFWTTTNTSTDEIYNTGLTEVKRIRDEMERVKAEVKFNGDLKAFFEFMKTDKRFMPYKTPTEVLAAFAAIQKKIDPKLKDMFGRKPKTPLEIRQTEAFRAASASAEYNQGSVDGKRPGIFYVPILDAIKFNTTSGMESLFLHEAIPGHHYQISLQQENDQLPGFRRFSWYGAYGEGWALYCESLGKELGCYTDPYQYMGALGDEMHRAVRLVVDVAMHTGKMNREEAIKYMMENEAISEEGATAEIERYMAIPAQALSYKTGALKIKSLREKYKQQLGTKFSIAKFHDEFLKDGCMPLDVIERKMDSWTKKQ